MPDLPTIWFVLVGVLLAGYAVLDGFDLGVGMLHLVVARNADERRALMRTIGPVWDGNEVWLLTMGGALFAAFPLVYATVFSGFYLALMLLLVALIGRAVSLEFRGHVDDARWRRVWDVVFSVCSALPALLFGVAIGNVAAGVPLSAEGQYEGGLPGLLNPFAVSVGLLSVALFAMHGATWLMVRTEGALRERARLAALLTWPAVAVSWVAVTLQSRAVAPHLWNNFDALLPWVAPAGFVVAAVLLALSLWQGAGTAAFAASAVAILALVATLGASLYPALLPDAAGGAGLTITNSASSDLSLTVMLVIAAIGMPIVVAYTVWIYSRFWGPVDRETGY